MINCKTQEEANELCQMMHDRDMGGRARWWKYYKENTCYAFYHNYCSVSYYEREGYKVVTFQDFKAYHDQKLKPLWHSSDELPTTSQDVLVITELGTIHIVAYSKKHDKFNVLDYYTDEIADNLCLPVARWCSVDDILNITSVSEKGTACR